MHTLQTTVYAIEDSLARAHEALTALSSTLHVEACRVRKPDLTHDDHDELARLMARVRAILKNPLIGRNADALLRVARQRGPR